MNLPYLPKKQVEYVIIGENYNNEIYNSLKSLGITPLFFQKCTNVRQGIQNHADLGVFSLDSDNFLLSKEQIKLKNQLKTIGKSAEFIDEDLSFDYPNDVLLNCVIIGNHIIYNPNTVSAKINDFVSKTNLVKIKVKQGYTKCSIAPVSVDSFITDDISIGCKAAEFGLDVLVISKGEIKLCGFDYGFIGGATGKISEHKMVITGSAEKLSDYCKIKKFLYDRDVELISLSKSEVEDIGSIIPVI